MKAAYENNQNNLQNNSYIYIVSKEGFFTHRLNEKSEETLFKIKKIKKKKSGFSFVNFGLISEI